MKKVKKFLLATIAATILFNGSTCFPGNYSGVLTAQAAVKINKKTAVLAKGQSVTLKILGNTQKVRWSSNRKSVATVSSKGKVIAKGRGTATITGKIGKKKYTCKITVQIPAINKKTVSLTVGQKTTLRMTGTTKKVSWKSSNIKVATVDRYGRITGKKAGTATITATVLNKKYPCKVTVKAKNAPDTFSETKAKTNISKKIITANGYIYVLLESSYNCPTEISAKCTFYNDEGDPVDYSTSDIMFLEKGHKGVLSFPAWATKYSTYKIEYAFSEGLKYYYHKSVIDGLGLHTNYVESEYGDYIMATVTNSNSCDCYYVEVLTVFYDDTDSIIAIEPGSLSIPANGSDSVKNFIPYDRTTDEALNYDHYESFISYAYHLGK